MSKVIAIIVTYNPDLHEFHEQIQAIRSEGIEVVVVDNCSAERPTLDELCSKFDGVTFIANGVNLGLAEAQNIGIRLALQSNPSHLMFFDQDSIPQRGLLRRLLDSEQSLLDRGIAVSAVGPATFDPANGSYYPITKYSGPFIRRHYPKGDEPIEATFLISSGSLIRRKVLEEVGLMRSELFIDYIDVEWCLRARDLDYLCFVSPAACMSHRIGDSRLTFFGRSISAHSPLRRYYLMRNSFLMLRLKHIPLSYKIREIFLNLVRFSIFLYISPNKKTYLGYMRRALADGIAGRFGKY